MNARNELKRRLERCVEIMRKYRNGLEKYSLILGKGEHARPDDQLVVREHHPVAEELAAELELLYVIDPEHVPTGMWVVGDRVRPFSPPAVCEPVALLGLLQEL